MARRSWIADESTTSTQFSVNCKTYFHIKVAARSRARERTASERTRQSRQPLVKPFPPPLPLVLGLSLPFLFNLENQRSGPGPILQSRLTCTGGDERGERVGCKTPWNPGEPFPYRNTIRCRIDREHWVATGNLCRKRNRECWPEWKGTALRRHPVMDFHSGNTHIYTHTHIPPASNLFSPIIITLCSQNPLRSERQYEKSAVFWFAVLLKIQR